MFTTFCIISTEFGQRLAATPEHFVQVEGSDFIPVGNIAAGDTMYVQSSEASIAVKVASVQREKRAACFAPFTL